MASSTGSSLTKIKRLKITLKLGEKKPLHSIIIVLEEKAPIIKSIYLHRLNTDVVVYNSKFYKKLIGWNIWSVLRYMFEQLVIECIERIGKDGNWVKLSLEKVKDSAYEPMK